MEYCRKLFKKMELIINDNLNQAFQTISDIYGVTDRAVRYWKTKYRNHQSDFFPGLDGAERVVRLALSVKEAGLRYQKEGRGSKGRVNYPRPNKQ